MNVQTVRADRPRLSLQYGRNQVGQPMIGHLTATLSGRELRRIVSEMLG